jgi:hypothetical protein
MQLLYQIEAGGARLGIRIDAKRHAGVSLVHTGFVSSNIGATARVRGCRPRAFWPLRAGGVAVKQREK